MCVSVCEGVCLCVSECVCVWGGFTGGSAGKNLPAIQELQDMQAWSLGWANPLEDGMETHSSILVWRIPWAEEAGGL